jgi:hypothetical protein
MPAADTPRLPTTTEELRDCLAKFVSPESLRAGLSFRPQPTDVFLSAYPKSGTTWLQQTVHGLRTRGAMDFDEITRAVPWVELALDMGLDLDAPQAASPRAFKTHLRWQDVPGGGRYIHLLRDPKDVLVSTYHFYEGWRFEPGSVSISEFAMDLFMKHAGRRRYWHHLAGWWRERGRPEVLMICYEDMKEDFPGTVRKVAHFIGCPLDDDLLGIVLRQSSIDFMREHRDKFDDHLLREATNAACGLPPGGASAKVRGGRVGDHRDVLPDQVIAALDAAWHDEVAERLGPPSYEALRAQLKAESRG